MPNTTPNACKLKASRFPISILNISRCDAEEIAAYLEQQLNQSEQFLKFAPLVLQFSTASDPDISDLEQALEKIRELAFIPSGIICSDAFYQASAARLKLPYFGDGQSKPAESKASSAGNTAQKKSKIIDRPVRSGQQIYAAQSDLIVIGQVSQGAEIIADGSVHVYGKLLGKAIAGAAGDESGRIFAQDFRPELVAIAGHYRIFETQEDKHHGQPVQVSLNGEEIKILPISQ